MNAIAYLENDGGCEEGKAALIFVADDMAADINRALDLVNLPGVRS